MLSRLLLSSIVLLNWMQNGLADDTSTWITVNDNDPAVTYSPGVGADSRNGYFHSDMHTAQAVGQWVAFSFTGSGVKWIGSRNADHGQAEVYIDGKLDGTVSSVGPTWTLQQDIYSKTGLPFGPHTMKIVLKTPNFQDFDAFSYYGRGPAQEVSSMPKIEGVELPAQQPLLNPASRYPIGNGVAVAVCGPTGQIETVFGPCYTTPDLLGYENISVAVDNADLGLDVEMRRASGTGVFYGSTSRGDVDIGVVDYACQGQPWLSRLIVFKNNSKTANHSIVVRDNISPRGGKGYSSALAMDKQGNPVGFTVKSDTTIGVSDYFKNPVDKSVVIAFSDPAASASSGKQDATIQSKPISLAPGEQRELSVTHYFLAGHDETEAQAIEAMRALDPHAKLQQSISEWKDWFTHVASAYALSRIKDPRGRVLMEGALVILKTNQSKDGGVIAHTTYYKEGYVRDAAMSIRGLLSTGHTEEAKEWLAWCDKKLSIDHHFADAMMCSVSLDDPTSSFNMGDMNVEEPGWVLLCARDYYAQTHDLAFLKSIDRTLRYSADVQLQEAQAHDGKMAFNGDETEICGAVDFHATGCAGVSTWALSSVAMAAASLDFYIDYVKATGGDPSTYHNAITNTTMDLVAEKKKMIAAMDRDFWRTDVADIPGGFHDFARIQADNGWPKARLVNLTLMPVFFSTDYSGEEKMKDVAAMAQSFDAKNGFLPLVPGANTGMEGQDLGYLLWGLVETGDWRKHEVYSSLINGKTVDAWGGYSEAYDAKGNPNGHDMRSLETGVNVSAMAKYWGLGDGK